MVPMRWLLAMGVGAMLVDGSAGQDKPKRPAPAIVAAWEKAGAEFGWMSIDGLSQCVWQAGDEAPAPGALPGFLFRVFPFGRARSLPSPDIDFGLWLAGSGLNNPALKEIRELKNMRMLNAAYTSVTNDGLSEVKACTRLRVLHLAGNNLSDDAIENLAPLKDLEWLRAYPRMGFSEFG